MCGLTGFVDFTNQSDKGVLHRMTDALRHRGPDDKGVQLFKKEKAIIGLGHRRLSILDLSKAGQQPMRFKHLHIIFNGEAYNFQEIRKELEEFGYHFHSHTDTEVILKAYDYWGKDCVHKFIGMFAFTIYDERNKELIFFRDRAGVKPLYYYYNNGLFLFGSELKSIMEHSHFPKQIDLKALGTYFHYGYVPAPYSIFKNTNKLEPGSLLSFSIQKQSFKQKRYWKASDFYEKKKFNLSYSDAKQELERLLGNAFNYRMIADVPVGVFLSGGYDSTAVTALLQKQKTQTLKTFTIGFQAGNDESQYAKKTAKYLGTDHHEMICTTKEAQNIVEDIPYYYDEPFADSSAVPTILISRFANKHVKVALSADGGDEVFGGYRSYRGLTSKLQSLNYIPASFKSLASAAATGVSNVLPDRKYRLKHMSNGIAYSLHQNKSVEALKLHAWANRRPKSLIENLFSKEYSQYRYAFNGNGVEKTHPIESAMLYDYLRYLPDDILTKVDRATMSTSLEGRDPMLDHRILEFTAQLPFHFKVKNGNGKRILKDIVHEYVPKTMMDRPKKGFSIPLTNWLTGDLNELMNDYLSETSLKKSGILDVEFVQKQKSLLEENKLHYKPLIWKLLAFQMWYDGWM